MTSQLAGKIAPKEILTNIPNLISAYYSFKCDISNPLQQVSFGTSGHRGSSIKNSFNEDHVLAISQAICEYRKSVGVDGPMFIGIDTHALSTPAQMSAIEVFAANGVEIMVAKNTPYTPTPVISHAILTYNKKRSNGLADGVVITPSHNPPADGGYKYNPTNGGPAGAEITDIIQKRANEIIQNGLKDVKRMAYEKAIKAPTTHYYDFITPYVTDLKNIIDLDAISKSGLKIGVDPMGGSGVDFWEPIAKMYNLDIEIVNSFVDPTFAFMCVDKDGEIRMDCSSPYAMNSLIGLKDRFDIAFGNDPDNDRHGIVTKSGLMNPNHYLSVAINYLFQNRPMWKKDISIGKTLVSSSMIDRVAKGINKPLKEVPVGFKWFVDGLVDGSLGFGGEESAGASFLRFDGSVWSTDKDGIILNLLAAEITAKTNKNPSEHYMELEKKYGAPIYERMDAKASPEQKTKLKKLSADDVRATTLAGEPIVSKLTKAPGNNESIGGLKVTTENGWFAARPSGTEDVYKIYAESFISKEHLKLIQKEAQELVSEVIK